ncbi:protein O-linked-mannose beta-1,4-N-acetylglucosaminyltransferase 2 isoform X1 [Procambarus clarkii]|uniref:protein O-linked-mannose beta-1,4-N-acetylglucosaminyltransferase 2 isoform X1 n=2 Tax=Procambarus clarkii TaxID=6728 RepID=UPI0037427F88
MILSSWISKFDSILHCLQGSWDATVIGMSKDVINKIILTWIVVLSTCQAHENSLDVTLNLCPNSKKLVPFTANERIKRTLNEPHIKGYNKSPACEDFYCYSWCRDAWIHNHYSLAFWNATKKFHFTEICSLHHEKTAAAVLVCGNTWGSDNIVAKSSSGHNKVKPHSQLLSSANLAPFYSFSSVWCYSSPESGLRCRFQNIYYNPGKKEFVFALSPNSVLYGINSIKTLEEHLYMSSVVGHNAFQISITTVPYTSFFTKYKYKTVHGESLLIARFKPDNLLHVFHDDLLPIYFTMREICMNYRLCIENMKLIFIDDMDKTIYWDLYQVMSKNILMSDNLLSRQMWYCFESAHIGLNKQSVWYQYGYGKPQGPQVRSTFSGHLLRQFTAFIKEKLNIEHQSTNIPLGILISRKYNRKILNEDQLSVVIKDQLRLHASQKDSEVKVLSLEENNLVTLVGELSQARAAIGMHGAALILGMFLPPGAVLIEIWPYGINSSAATVYKTMCELKGFGVTHVPWMNEDPDNTIYHPEYPSFYGGLSHLSLDAQEDMIKRLHESKLKDVECCDNINWLFRIYQDTKVHTTESDAKYKSDPFSRILKESLRMSEENLVNKAIEYEMQLLVYPSKVQGVQCYLIKAGHYTELLLKWEDPWNIRDINCQDIYFEVFVEIEGDSAIIRNIVSDRQFKTKFKFRVENVHTWITCFCNNIEGSVFFKKCSL